MIRTARLSRTPLLLNIRLNVGSKALVKNLSYLICVELFQFEILFKIDIQFIYFEKCKEKEKHNVHITNRSNCTHTMDDRSFAYT